MDEITKEKTIEYGCAQGYHLFNTSTARIVGNELFLTCTICGNEISRPSPIQGAPVAPKEQGNMETVEDTSKHGEPKLSPNPYDEINRRSTQKPIWADQVKSRYEQDKNLDDFFADIKKKALG